jgi:hypothetical protein
MHCRIQILAPRAGMLVAPAAQLVVETLVLMDDTWSFSTQRETIATLANQLQLVLMDNDGNDYNLIVPYVVSTSGNKIIFTVPAAAIPAWPTITPMGAMGAWKNTILVFLDRKTDFCRMTIYAGAGNQVIINHPAAGAGVTYPFTAFGTSHSTAVLQGQIRVPITGQTFNGTVVQGPPNWQITFNSGPSGQATLKITDTANNVFSSESINGSTGGGGTG